MLEHPTNTEKDKISKRQIRAALKSVEGSAKIVNLLYIKDSIEGIIRKPFRGKFRYYYNNQLILDSETLIRIKKLSIPPAWTKVWICPNPDGHLQVTGYDLAQRKQYKYHHLWNQIRSHTKYFRLLEFGLMLPEIREKLNQELQKRGLTKEKILATIITILDTAYLRIGNNIYEKLNGSYGLTTLKNKHVSVEGDKIRFCFIGKKGIRNNISIKNKKIASIIKRCMEIPGKQLFGYLDDDGQVIKIDSGMVNEYIYQITGKQYTAKDFRTWAGSIVAIKAFKQLESFTSETDKVRKINQMYDLVASELGNTRKVCKNHYVHPLIVDLYEEGRLERYLNEELVTADDTILKWMKPEEMALIKILKRA
jgi:DNA topoisomerase I